MKETVEVKHILSNTRIVYLKRMYYKDHSREPETPKITTNEQTRIGIVELEEAPKHRTGGELTEETETGTGIIH